ncbi:uncharacterized protein LOC110886453 [Helianthus annuus]|uniref:uncharacterized protein LOC110886453 n=1 Tax=Helianthus annuus TaxID=4232 RepID=UPI000B8EFCF6|nr:uncharacterized protein LOC110886453 [Helianthus annuus]
MRNIVYTSIILHNMILEDSGRAFCGESYDEGVNFIYGRRYLTISTATDVPLLYKAHKRIHGFPGMLGSLGCTHWEWPTCLTAWKGQHHGGNHDSPTLILQANASQDLWIWHAYFGMAGAKNDIAVLQSSNNFNDVIDGVAPYTSLYANDVEYMYGYYLVDDIYPEWAMFVKSFSCPDDVKRLYLKKKKKLTRKDVERAFGVLKKMVYHCPAVEDT